MAARTKNTGDVNVVDKPVPLRTVVWRNENRKPSVHDNSDSPNPPPWSHGTWTITRFEVLENGAILHLWWAAK